MISARKDLQDMVDAIQEGGSPRVLADALLANWRGAYGLARELRQEYEACPVKGHANRLKILNLVITVVLKFAGDDDEDESLEDAEDRLSKLKGMLREGGTDGDG